MSEVNRIYIANVAMVTPVGNNALMSAASINASVSAIAETGVLNKKLKPIKMGLVREDALVQLNPKLLQLNLPSRQMRLLRLAASALKQLSQSLPNHRIPLYLALPENLPEKTQSIKGNFIEQLAIQSSIAFNIEQSLIAEVGRPGALYAMKHAQRFFAESGEDYLLVGGVDTYWDMKLLAKLDSEDRLMVDGSVDGFFPGEGASFTLLVSDRVKHSLPSPHVSFASPGLATEAGHFYSDEPYRGDGLSAAVSKSFDTAASGTVDSIWTSMIYDSFCSKEFGVALTRNNSKFSKNVKMRHPVDCLGDMGAAMGSALLGLIFSNASKKSQGTHHLVCCSSDLSHRAALRVDIDRQEI